MAQKISVVIPNYNGKEILSKNLPLVLKYCPDFEIIIVDDASTDDSVQFVKDNFKKVKLVTFEKNQGFAVAANTGVNAASAPLVLLLNSDVCPTEGFLKEALVHFKSKEVFAVGLSDRSHEDDKIIIRGRGGVKFTKGFLLHFAKNPKAGQTFWVSGGSSLFDKKKFLELGGFDKIYAPFYWEDIDLCYRARKNGNVCLYEPKSEVDHYHQEGAIKRNYSAFYIKTVSYKNQFIFVWKNISDYSLIIKHILWLPYHFAKALLSQNLPFFVGFLWAISTIPHLIFNFQLQTTNYQLSDKEVLSGFEEQ